MSSFDLDPKSLFDTFHEIEEGVYFKHYGIELPQNEVVAEMHEMTSFGAFEEKALLWQKQIVEFGDCVALHAIVGNSLYGDVPCQSNIMKEYENKGLFQPQWGSSFDDVVELLQESGMELALEARSGCDLTELIEDVDGSGEVICYVNRMLLDCEYPLPGLNADGLVHVIGVEFSDTEGDYVVLNDPSSDGGAGRRVSLERFLDAWATSGNTVITVMRR